MLAKTTAGGMCLAFPDVCLTPSPAGPVPIPYPNISLHPTSVGFVPNVLVTCAPPRPSRTGTTRAWPRAWPRGWSWARSAT